MKKLSKTLIIISLSIISQNSFAERSGMFAGVDLIKSNSTIESEWRYKEDQVFDNLLKTRTSRSAKLSGMGIGGNVSYSYNYKNFFIAPGLDIQFLNNKDKFERVNGLIKQEFSIRSRTAIKADLGYEIANRLAIFIPAGINIINYQANTSYGDLNNNVKGSATSPFVGAGFSLKLIDDIYLNGEYNYTTIDYKKPIFTHKITGKDITLEGKAHINTMKAGISWNFQI